MDVNYTAEKRDFSSFPVDIPQKKDILQHGIYVTLVHVDQVF
jgi:hypothetical protein